jgi:hypothetical protein
MLGASGRPRRCAAATRRLSCLSLSTGEASGRTPIESVSSKPDALGWRLDRLGGPMYSCEYRAWRDGWSVGPGIIANTIEEFCEKLKGYYR